MKPLVSVCINTYNRKKKLYSTLQSILKQTYKNIEIIIVDDCSTDNTEIFVKNKLLKLNDKIRYIRHKKNKGLAAGRNTAILNSKGKYFAFCDDDDKWLPNFVEEFVSEAKKYNENWCFSCGTKYKNLLGTNVSTTFNYQGNLKNLIKKGYTPPVASQFYNLSTIKKIKGYNQKIKTGIDHDLWIRLAKINIRIKFITNSLSLPNTKQTDKRITTDYFQRINEIKKSLEIWKIDLIEMYNQTFYYKFYDAYMRREQIKFFNAYLKDLNFVMIFRLMKNISLIDIFSSLSISLLKILIKLFLPKFLIPKNNIKTIRPSLKIN